MSGGMSWSIIDGIRFMAVARAATTASEELAVTSFMLRRFPA
jgi:hypothetical protein